MTRRQYIPDHIRTASDHKLLELEAKALDLMRRSVVQNFMNPNTHKVALACKTQLELIASEKHYRFGKEVKR